MADLTKMSPAERAQLGPLQFSAGRGIVPLRGASLELGSGDPPPDALPLAKLATETLETLAADEALPEEMADVVRQILADRGAEDVDADVEAARRRRKGNNSAREVNTKSQAELRDLQRALNASHARRRPRTPRELAEERARNATK